MSHFNSLLTRFKKNSLAKLFLFSLLNVFALPAFAGVDLVVNLNDTGFDPVAAGANITYTLRVTNDGDTIATNTQAILTIPNNATFVSAAGTGVSCGALVGNDVTCDFATLTTFGGDEKTISIILSSNIEGTIELNVIASSDGPEEAAANNSALEGTTVNKGSDIALQITGDATIPSGDILTYTLSITNNGPDASGTQRISFPLPAGFSIISVPTGCTNNAGTIQCDSNPLALNASQSFTPITGRVIAASPSTITGSASVAVLDLSGPADPDASNNSATFDTTITAGTDVSIAKSRSVAGTIFVGDAFNFILSPSYSGDVPNDLTITDTIPSEYTINTGTFSASQNGWSCTVASQLITCTQATGSIAGFNVSLGDITIPVTVASTGTPTNSTTIAVVTPNDVNLTNNTATDGGATLDIADIDIEILKSAPNPALAVVGTPFNFTTSVRNVGNTSYTGNLSLTDDIPANMTLNSIVLNGWTCPVTAIVGPNTVTCTQTGVTLNAAASTAGPTFNVTVTAAGGITNTASVIVDTCNVATCDTNQTNNTTTSNVTTSSIATSADISLIKTADLASVPAGDILTYTIEVVNTGSGTASNVRMSDLITGLINSVDARNPGAFTGTPGYISEVVTPGTATFPTACATASLGATAFALNCDFTSIPVCTQGSDCPTIVIQIRPGGDGGTRNNAASAVSSVTPDPDPSNNSDNVDTTVIPRADISAAISDTPDPATAGQDLTYVITASNGGPSRAELVETTYTLPEDVTFVSATPSSGSCGTTPTAEATTTASNQSVICQLGTINNGSQQTVTVVVRPNNITRSTNIISNVSITTTTVETGSGVNTASTTTLVNNPSLDLILNLTDSVDPVAVGDATIYTLTIRNNGPSTSENVVLTNDLPGNGFLSFQSLTLPAGVTCPTQPAANDATGNTDVVCNLGNILSGDTVTILINMLGSSKGIATDTATVTSDDNAFETNQVNNAASETTTVRTKVDLEVFNKQAQNLSNVDISTVNLREDFQFLIQVRNNEGAGLAEADNVVLTDNLPTGMELTGTPTATVTNGTTTLNSCTGVAGDTSFTCDFGTVDNAATFDIIAPVQIVTLPAGAIINTASIGTDSRDIDGNNNSSDGPITTGNVLASSISGTVFRDLDNDGNIDAGDTGISGITITVTGLTFDGASISQSATTDINGQYTVSGLAASDATGYTVTEGTVSDPDLIDGKDTAGSLGGTLNATDDDRITAVVLPSNTDAINYNFAEQTIPLIGLAKSASALMAGGGGLQSVNYTFIIENSGSVALASVQLTDDLTIFGTFTTNAAPAAGQYTIFSAPSISNPLNNASITANSSFNGSSDRNLLTATSSSLPDINTGSDNQSRATVTIGVTFNPVTSVTINNEAIATATSLTGVNVTDDSVNGLTPDSNGDGDPTDDKSPTPVTPPANPLDSSISGTVFRDINNNGLIDAGDTGINGVTITLSGTTLTGVTISTSVTTNANGLYSFTGIPVPNATGYTLTEGAVGDPDLIDGKDIPGTDGGNGSESVTPPTNDTITAIDLQFNNDATGYNFAEQTIPLIGVAKSASGLTALGAGIQSVDYTFIIENSGSIALSNVQLTDNLDIFGTFTSNTSPAPGQYIVFGDPKISNELNNASITANPDFNGNSDQDLLLAASSSLPDINTGSNNQSRATVTITVNFYPATSGTINNTAIATGTSLTGTNVTDNSVDGVTPDLDDNGDPTDDTSPTPITVGQSLNIVKTSGNVVQTGATIFDIPFTLVVSNSSTQFNATFVQSSDNLSTTFPTANTISISSNAAVSNCTGTVLTVATPVFNGVSQTNLLTGAQNLQPGESCDIDFTARVDFTGNSLPSSITNTGIVTSSVSNGGIVIDTDSDTSVVNFNDLAAVQGRVWRDDNHNQIDDAEVGIANFKVEVTNAAGDIVGEGLTDSTGAYSVSGLFPSTPSDPNTFYQVRFIDPVSGAIFGAPVSEDPTAPNGTIDDGNITGLVLTGGVTTIRQSLPLDPSGVVYDSLTRQPIQNAIVSISGPAGFSPATQLVGGVNNVNQTTGVNGFYQFLLLPGAPSGVYTLNVTEPTGYLPGGSAVLPVCSNTLIVRTLTPNVAPIHIQPTAPSVSSTIHDANNCPTNAAAAVAANSSTQYYLSFDLDLLAPDTSADVVNNHIPLDLITDGAIVATKSTTKDIVIRGALVPYNITMTNTFSSILPNINVIDQIPSGFKYVKNSAKMAGVSTEPTVNGRVLTFENLTFAANESRLFNLLLIVGSGVNTGKAVNQTFAENNIINQRVSNIATASVRIVPDPLFDCTDVIGKVYDDANRNGYPDDGEKMLPGIRLVTAKGWIVTTDSNGRYHIACAAIPNAERGSNFVLKVDTRTLPSGYRVTTENPRVARLTAGKINKINFGATIHRVVRLDVADLAFEENSDQLKADFLNNIDALLLQLKVEPSVLRINYLADFEPESLAQQRLAHIKETFNNRWEETGCCYNLLVEEELFWRTGKSRHQTTASDNNNGGEE